MLIRKALPTDNSGAKALVRKSLASFGLIVDFDTLDAAIGALGLANTANEIELVAEVDGKLVGCLAIQRMEGAIAKLFGFHVDASMQGQGIGRTLLSEAIAQAVIHKLTQLELETWGNMGAAVHLYESLGWVRGPDPLPESGADRFYCLALVR
ncbi:MULTISPECIES: GNAT family N-acetyltransferase [unclassified Janthinobacterium]|uniref:GNAT family N-acetyltransferase n=1 Tax=unclassified Janthinobacterium TaxID=2610881 RepID=UPI0016212A15|nr:MULTISPECIES: GNAT family N-acetyltransferase [unclassified Janthinobacterium]MBB5610041.1 ribosomal protein S18 acetylase RimI-like enzyme [Janthinobacterium sp. S3T4]MBB5615325.1 ribosomal protein S18 acetylase RimI-like enzyme [Janthinobacterium sp. S3M3]